MSRADRPAVPIRSARIVAVSDELFGDGWNAGFGHDDYTAALVRASNVAMDAVEGPSLGDVCKTF